MCWGLARHRFDAFSVVVDFTQKQFAFKRRPVTMGVKLYFHAIRGKLLYFVGPK